jgi:xanthine dehydrogenase YagR molybdenum-binding subunit
MSLIGAPLTRTDGRAKVTGAAKYSAEFQVPNIAYAALSKARFRAATSCASIRLERQESEVSSPC